MDVSSVSTGASAYTNALKQKKEEAPKPVKNAEGQTTGSTINVTA